MYRLGLSKRGIVVDFRFDRPIRSAAGSADPFAVDHDRRAAELARSDSRFASILILKGEKIVDAERIGYWGSSYSGGHAVWIGSHDPRVKAVVAQVPAMDSAGFVEAMPGGLEEAHRQEIRRARGEILPAPIDARPLGELRGHPYASRMARYSPRSVAPQIRAPILILDAGKEELFDIGEHGRKVYEIVKDKVAAKYHVFPGITHYDIYRGKRAEAIAMAIEWFRAHLGRESR
jgi:hypothetical protein